MKLKIKHLVFFSLSLLAISCAKDFTEGVSPSEKNATNIKALRKKLTESKYGWNMVYFSKSDSLLFTNKQKILQKLGDYQRLYGVGGHYYAMKFNENGTVKMRADYTDETIKTTKESDFEINQNTFVQLSFTTFNYIHEIVNEEFRGASDFLYVGEDFKGNLIFKTSSYIDPAREYIVLQELTSDEAWDKNINTAYENRKFFDKMKNPQLTIHKGDRTFFGSDVVIKTDSPFEPYQKFLRSIPKKRFYLFEYSTVDDIYLKENKPQNTGLGSGYVGTEKGLSFYSGIRYDSNYIFYDFQRQDDKFVCELVKIYDPVLKFIYVSKHLFPDGEPTYMIAEIKDIK